jgi:hypothetical protein
MRCPLAIRAAMGVGHKPVPAISWGWDWSAEKSDHHQTQHDTDAHIETT